jgi:hypothetical protein
MELIIATRANAILYWFLLEKSKQDDCFILPSNICPEVLLTFLKAGKKIRFADLDPVHFCLDPGGIEKILRNEPVKGILYNHTYGTLFTPFKELNNFKNQNPDILLIDDKCLCTPEFTNEESVFDLTLFSTNSKKQTDLGFGGYAWVKGKIFKTPKPDYSGGDFSKMKFLVKSDPVGINDWQNISNLNWLKAEILTSETTGYFNLIKKNISEVNDHKLKLSNIYKTKLQGINILNIEFQNWRFNFRTTLKGNLLNTIFSEGLFAGGHYKSLGTLIEKRAFRIAESLEKEVINLFIDKYYSAEQATRTCEVINQSICN